MAKKTLFLTEYWKPDTDTGAPLLFAGPDIHSKSFMGACNQVGQQSVAITVLGKAIAPGKKVEGDGMQRNGDSLSGPSFESVFEELQGQIFWCPIL